MKLHVIYGYKKIYPALSGKGLTDALISLCLGREDVQIERSSLGKPMVKDASVFISVSHSGDTFALLTADHNVGLDIQYAREVKKDRIAARFFSEEETAAVSADDSGKTFFRLWTRKEAYCKYTGKGLGQIVSKDEVLSREDVKFMDLRLEDGCFCAVCADAEKGDESYEIQISYREQDG